MAWLLPRNERPVQENKITDPLVLYIDDQFNPTTKELATMARVTYPDGRSVLAIPQKKSLSLKSMVADVMSKHETENNPSHSHNPFQNRAMGGGGESRPYVKLETQGVSTQWGVGGQQDAFKLSLKDGSAVTGYAKDQDFPNEYSSPTRGEIFFTGIPESSRGKGIGKSLNIDALRVIAANGSTTVNMHGVSEGGRAIIASMIRDGYVSLLRTSSTGKSEYKINLDKLGARNNEPSYNSKKMYFQKIPEVKNIDPSKLKNMDMYEAGGVQSTIKASGLSEKDWAKKVDLSTPVDVSVFADGDMRIVDGHHRVKAANILGIKSIPVSLQAINAKGDTINKLITYSESHDNK